MHVSLSSSKDTSVYVNQLLYNSVLSYQQCIFASWIDHTAPPPTNFTKQYDSRGFGEWMLLQGQILKHDRDVIQPTNGYQLSIRRWR